MPIDPSIALNANAPNPLALIGQFQSLKGQQQQNALQNLALQQKTATLPTDIAREQALSSSAQSEAQVNAANVQPRIEQQAASTGITKQQEFQAGLETTAKRYGVQSQFAKDAMGAATALIQDPDVQAAAQQGPSGGPNGQNMPGSNPLSPKIVDSLIGAKQRYLASGGDPKTAELIFAPLLSEAMRSPETLQGHLGTLLMGIQGTPQGAGQAGQSLVPATAQVQGGPATPAGNPTILQRTPYGGIQQNPLPQGQGGAPMQFPPGESPDTFRQLSGEREAARTTMTQAPTVHRLNSEILSELDKATTGQYSGIIARAESLGGILGMKVSGSSDLERAASAYDLVDKYTTMAATRAAQSMGNDTATALNAQLKQNASVERNPTAIKKSIKLNDAILSGAEAYQQGLEHSIQNNPQQSVFIKRNFDQAWAQNFDPLVMQIYNASKSKDTAELKDLTSKLSPAQLQQIQQKAKNLQGLMRGM